MSTLSRRRLLQDFRELRKEQNDGVMAMPNEDNIMQWGAAIFGLVLNAGSHVL